MMRNDYRRTLILLRSHAEGYSGHVRLERRTLMGGMYFMAQAPQDGGALQAALVGRGRTGYYACPLGELKQDGRGQACLSYSFDPRRICGRELEQYQLVAVARIDGEDCEIVLSGNVDGHAELNWERVRQALCLRLMNGGTAREAAPEEEAMPPEEPTQEEVQLQEEPEETQEEESQEERTAGEALGLDMDVPWPEAVEPLRARFAEQPVLSDAPENGYAYIALPLPEGSPYPGLAAGIRMEAGVPAAVCYAIAAPWSAQPPAGLEEYAWIGDNNRGWWAVEIDLATGERG